MRKQYHFRPSSRGFNAWDVDRLIRLSSDLEERSVPLTDIAEIDEDYWSRGSEGPLSCRTIAEHARLIQSADLRFPIIMCSRLRVMDGMHRVLKALNEGCPTIRAVVFEQDPEPDFVDVLPGDLPY